MPLSAINSVESDPHYSKDLLLNSKHQLTSILVASDGVNTARNNPVEINSPFLPKHLNMNHASNDYVMEVGASTGD